ncbi:phosphate ABC transporter permease PstA [Malacoplasma iowae]|uniref:Phosphate transport system permease protein PstA n=1 Tax=Malacoplasma iowae 695 TaxID=1048830 RepID=A0A6P1LMY5_MALIO|nr:phosphate ABC transporter permease PstA [Malacoplasma iowae]VEU61942.1 Phosphate transport system permease protein pstC [Mycoplasmopsis fermentans]EGZ31107.1 phosphate ABC transporter permease PstA [Malacoplasma iowae 695]QHG90303.2 phosphate ABC transporter permease PstA [Malacoplasma iowae 695]WPL36215.1 phosphate ABC transporter permease PstA [Malacoplasma iowae]WPL38499.1 phosphate ABC transporter permease PstA [Malacoplasma iowae]
MKLFVKKDQLKKDVKQRRITFDLITEKATLAISLLMGLVLFGIIGFILYKSILGFQFYGIENILFSNSFNISDGKNTGTSFWLPFSSTILTTFISLLIAVPIGIKTSVFIKFRIKKKYRKIFRIISETLAGIPSVIFGLFASISLGEVMKFFGISSYSIINASIMLSFMVLPTIIAMTLNSLESVDDNLLTNPITMGNTKTRAIYKVYKKAARNGIIVGVILAMGRAIGETMALSMILQNESRYSDVLSSGLIGILTSDLKTISVVISTNMFGENANETTRSLLFAFGFILFVFIMIFNLMVLFITKSKNNKKHKFKWIDTSINFLVNSFMLIPNAIANAFDYVFFSYRRKTKLQTPEEIILYTRKRTESYKLANVYTWYKLMWEIISVSICFAFLAWLILDIISNGLYAWGLPSSTVFQYSKNTTGQAFLNTLLIIIVSIFISLPFALLTAIYLTEYSKNKMFKTSVNFFLDSLGSTPSILFGMFGLIFFIETLGMTSGGSRGYSLIAGALTIVLVIIPSFTRSIQQILVQIPNEIRTNALALGTSKLQLITKIILPSAITGIVSTTILSIGRVLSETAPLYLTAGLTSSSAISLDRSGQTLTTRIYAQLFNIDLVNSTNIMYEVALVTLLLVLGLIFIGYYIVPNYKKIIKYLDDKTTFLYVWIKDKIKNK